MSDLKGKVVGVYKLVIFGDGAITKKLSYGSSYRGSARPDYIREF